MDVVIPTNLVCILLFTLPSLLHPSIHSIVFILISIPFFIIIQCILHGLLIQLQCTSVAKVPKFTRAQKISCHTPMLRQAGKEATHAALVAMIFLS